METTLCMKKICKKIINTGWLFMTKSFSNSRNCCIFAVPWLEFFGYGAYLWNVMWILDLARFTQQPLAPASWIKQQRCLLNGGDL